MKREWAPDLLITIHRCSCIWAPPFLVEGASMVLAVIVDDAACTIWYNNNNVLIHSFDIICPFVGPTFVQKKSYASYNHPPSNLMYHEGIFLLKSSDRSDSCHRPQDSSWVLSTNHPQALATLIIAGFWFLNLLQCKQNTLPVVQIPSHVHAIGKFTNATMYSIQYIYLHYYAQVHAIFVPEKKSLRCQSAPHFGAVFSFVAPQCCVYW